MCWVGDWPTPFYSLTKQGSQRSGEGARILLGRRRLGVVVPSTAWNGANGQVSFCCCCCSTPICLAAVQPHQFSVESRSFHFYLSHKCSLFTKQTREAAELIGLWSQRNLSRCHRIQGSTASSIVALTAPVCPVLSSQDRLAPASSRSAQGPNSGQGVGEPKSAPKRVCRPPVSGRLSFQRLRSPQRPLLYLRRR